MNEKLQAALLVLNEIAESLTDLAADVQTVINITEDEINEQLMGEE